MEQRAHNTLIEGRHIVIKKFVIASTLAAALAACSPKQFESAPVTVDTAQGPVVCQLYTKNLTDWDRSISHPDAMSVAEADRVCEAEGLRQQRG